MSKTINIKNWKTGEVIFSYTHKFNAIAKTVDETVKQGVSLSYADLKNADLSYANLKNADLSYANLKNTILKYSDLNNTNLSNANLYGAYLDFSDLSTAILDNVKGLNDQCPKEGSFIGWKKCYASSTEKIYLVKLEIPEDAKRSSATTNKCRCSKAKVLEIQNIDGTKADVDTVYSGYDKNFRYKISEIVEVPYFNERYWIECSSGIHFFIKRKDAVNYFLVIYDKIDRY